MECSIFVLAVVLVLGTLAVSRIDNFHAAFVVQALEPVLQQLVNVLLQQNLMDVL